MSARLEIATFNPSSALLALRSGAQRIELCSHKDSDGLTPEVQDFLDISSSLSQSQPVASSSENDNSPEEEKGKNNGEINIMIRPHDNSARGIGTNENFRVGNEVFERMKEEIRIFRRAGARGFVFGILKDDYKQDGQRRLVVDTERCAELINTAREGKDGKNVRCTFHRAFDRIDREDMEGELEVLISLNITSLLTSGGYPTSVQGVAQIQKLVRQAAERIDIIVGGGVRSRNSRELLDGTGARWFHSSAVMGEGEEVDGEEVRRLRAILWDARG